MKLHILILSSLIFLHSASVMAADEPANATPGSETSSQPQPQDKKAPTPHQQRQADLALEQSAETELIWLELEEQHLALQLTAASPTTQGSILIIPAQGTSADWPTTIHPLRTQLIEHGWNTLTLDLPPSPAEQIPERTLPVLQQRDQLQTTEASQSSNPDSAKSKDSQQPPRYSELVLALTRKAIEHLNNLEGDRLIILGVGDGAVWALNLASQTELKEQTQLVLLDPQGSTAPHSPDPYSLLSETEQPVLDLWFDNTLQQKESAKLRRHARLRSEQKDKLKSYRQIRINTRIDVAKRDPQWLTKQIRGILKTNKPVTEIPQEQPAPKAELMPGS